MVTISAPALDPSMISGPIEVLLNNQKYALIDWKSYEEMAKAKRNAEYLDKLDRGFAQMKAGQGQVHDLIEVEDE